MHSPIRTASALAVAAAPALTSMFGVAPAGAAPARTTPPTERASARNCATEALTPSELAAGAVSVVICDDTAAGAVALAQMAAASGAGAAALGSTALAQHYDSTGGQGQILTVYGSACDGSGVSFAAGDSWNDRIQSTRHAACPNVKHWVDANFGGASQLTQGAPGVPVDLNATLARNVSSIRYYGS